MSTGTKGHQEGTKEAPGQQGNAKKAPGMNFRVGDYVMITTGKNQASKRRTHKLNTKW